MHLLLTVAPDKICQLWLVLSNVEEDTHVFIFVYFHVIQHHYRQERGEHNPLKIPFYYYHLIDSIRSLSALHAMLVPVS